MTWTVPVRARRRWAAMLVGATIVAFACLDQSTGPAAVPAYFAVAPSFASPAAIIVPVSQANVRLTRSDGTVALDTTVSISPTDSTVDLNLTVVVVQTNEVFQLTIVLLDAAGDTAFTGGPVSVSPSTTSSNPPTVAVSLSYTGVGSDAAGVVITTPDTTVLPAATVVFLAEARDAGGSPILGTPIAWSSTNPQRAAVVRPDSGRVLTGTQRGTVGIVATLLTGPADTVTLTVAPQPTNLLAESGSGQTGAAGALLGSPIVARVLASDGLGVPGVPVVFRVASGGGVLSQDTVSTDQAGRASVQWTLGQVVGSQEVEATTPVLPGDTATFIATATGGAGPGAIVIVEGDGQTALAGSTVSTAPKVLVEDAAGTPVAGATVNWTITRGGGSLVITPQSSTTDSMGLATLGSWTLGALADTNLLAVSVDSLSPVTFTAVGTGVNGAWTMIVAQGNGQSATVGTAVAVAPGVEVRDTAGAVVAGVPVAFNVVTGGGVPGVDTALTDSVGLADVGSWVLGPTAGGNSLQATSRGLSSVLFSATGTVGAPDTIMVVSGDSQTADAGTILPNPLVIEVRDNGGNPVPSVTVDWTAFQGTLTSSSTQTNASGQTQNTWTLGTNAIEQTATATVTDLTPAVFSATAVFQNPSILLSLVGATRIPLGDSVLLDVTLTAPAPAGGVTVTVTNDNTSRIAVAGDGTVFIDSAGTSGTIWLAGLTGGVDTVRATASGYTDGVLPVVVSVQVLALPASLNVPFGGTASLPVQISSPAPVGGVAVTLISDNSAAVSVLTPTVTIAEGSQTTNATLSGVAPGTATITGTTEDYGSAQSSVATTANLNILPNTTVFINETFGATLTVRLESSGAPIPAPAGGIPVTLVARDPGCAVATSPVTIPAGLIDTTSQMAWGGSTATTCFTYMVATSPNIDPDSVYVRVDPAPPISLGTVRVGAGLQINTSGSLGASNHGGVNVVVRSLDPTLGLISPNTTTPGTDSVAVFLINGSTTFGYYVQGVEGVAASADTTFGVEVSATGFITDTVFHQVTAAGVRLTGVPSSTTTLSPDAVIYVELGAMQTNRTSLYQFQSVRAGGDTLVATLQLSDSAIAQVKTSTDSGGTVVVPVLPGNYRSPTSVGAGGAAFDPIAGGTVVTTATIPGVLPETNARTTTISAPTINLGTARVGAGLQINTSGSLGASNHGGVDVVFRNLDPTLGLISPNATTPGTDSVLLHLNDGSTSFGYYVQGVEGVAASADTTFGVEVSAAGFVTDTVFHQVTAAGVRLTGVPTSTTTLSPDAAIYVELGAMQVNRTSLYQFQTVRAGGDTLVATLQVGDSAIARLKTSVDTGGTVVVPVAPLNYRSPTSVGVGGAAFDPIAGGTVVTTATIPGVLPETNARTTTISAPTISLGTARVGAGLQINTSGSLGASNHGGVWVYRRSLDPALGLLSPNVTTPGVDLDSIFLSDGSTSFGYYVQGVEGVAASADTTFGVEVSAAGFVTDTVFHTVTAAGIRLTGVPTSTTTLSPDAAIYVELGAMQVNRTSLYQFQTVRAGGDTLVATFRNSNPSVLQFVTSTITAGDSVEAKVPPQQYRSPTSVAAGGVAVDPLTAGSATVSATIPGVLPETNARTVTVTTPGITLNAVTVGAGLQLNASGSLGATQHGGVDIVIKSSNPSVALVSPNSTTPGTDSIIISLANGFTSFGYYVQGVLGATGTVSISARANGFTDGSTSATIVQPALRIDGLVTSTDTTAVDDVFQVTVGIPNAQGTTLQQFQNASAALAGPLTFTVVSSDSTVGLLVTSAEPDGAGTVSVDIAVGTYFSGSSVAAGGVAFRPILPGTTTVSASNGLFLTTGDGARVVTVNP